MRLPKGELSLFVAYRKERILWFQGEICEGLARMVKRALSRMNHDSREPIKFYIWSGGGDIPEEKLIMRALNRSRAPVIFIAFRKIASAALTIFQYGSQRYALPRTRLEFHQAHMMFFTDPKCRAVTMGSRDCIKMFHELKHSDAISMQAFSRTMNPRTAEVMLAQEKTIGVARAIRLGMVNGYWDRAQFNRDHRAVSRHYHRTRHTRP